MLTRSLVPRDDVVRANLAGHMATRDASGPENALLEAVESLLGAYAFFEIQAGPDRAEQMLQCLIDQSGKLGGK